MMKWYVPIIALLVVSGSVSAETDPHALKAIRDIQDGNSGRHEIRTLYVRGERTSVFDGAVDVEGALNANGITATGNVQAADLIATDDVLVSDDVAITGDLSVTGSTTAASVSLSGALTTTENVGAANGTGVSAAEQMQVHRTVITLSAHSVTLADEAGVVAYGSSKIYDMPQGYIYAVGAVADLTLTTSTAGVNADWDGDIGLGTAAAGNNATLASTEQDLIPTTATPQASASTTTGDAVSTATEHAIFDGTGTAKDVYLNILVDDADHDVTATPCNLIVDGTITLTWYFLGDN